MFRAALEGSTLPSPCRCVTGVLLRSRSVSGVSDRRWGVSAGDSEARGGCVKTAANTTLRPEAPGFNPQNKSTANACETLCC